MKRNFVTGGAVLILGGCIFGGSDEADDPVVIDNGTNNGTNNVPDADALVIRSATVVNVDCTPNETAFIVPEVDSEFAVQADSGVAYSSQTARLGLLENSPEFGDSLAWASVVGSELRVTVAPFQEQNRLELGPAFHATTTIADGAEIYSLELEPNVVQLRAGEALWKVTAGTSDGVKECSFRLPGSLTLELVPDCSEPFIQGVLTGEEVLAAETFDYVPILEPNGDGYRVDITRPSAVISASGPGPGGDNYLGLVRFDNETLRFTPIGTSAVIDSTLPAPEIFAARMAWGLSEKEGGWPALQVLARDADGDEYRPRVLIRGESGYVADDVGSWPLPPGVTIDRTNFTFLDGYEAITQSWENAATYQGGIDVDPDQSSVKHGYAALNDDGQVLFARPGGLLSGDVDLIEADVAAGGVELRALRNIPVDRSNEAYPVILVVEGEERASLSMMYWGFGESVEVLSNAFGGQFEGVRSLTSPTLLDTQNSVLGFVATRDGDTGIGLFPFTDADSATFRAAVCSDI